MRLLPCQRLHRQADFEQVRLAGFRIHCGAFTFYGRRREPGGSSPDGPNQRPRVGIVTSRRIGRAVVRNRARRMMRAIFSHHQERLPAGSDVVLVMRASFVRETFRQLEVRFLRACANFEKQEVKRISTGDAQDG